MAEVTHIDLNEEVLEITDKAAREEMSEMKTNLDECKIIGGANGNPITIADSAEASLRTLTIYGNTEQDSTTGKNLLDCSGLTEQTINGITFTPVYDDTGLLQYINVNGTATAHASYPLNANFQNEKTVILSGCPNGGSIGSYRITADWYKDNVYSSYTHENGDGVQIDAGIYDYGKVYIFTYSGTVCDNLKFYPMIRDASITDATYEPFTNGASPNPDYPQEIKSVEIAEIRTHGNQFFDKDNPTLNAVISSGVVVENAQYRLYAIHVETGKNYTLTKPSMNYCFVGFCNEIPFEGVTLTDRANLATITERTITATDSYLCLIFNNDEDLSGVILNLGTVALPYEPYTESTATISAELNGLNGVQDCIDREKGVKVQKFTKVVLDGSEEWYKADNTSYSETVLRFYTMPKALKVGSKLMCDKFVAKESISRTVEGVWAHDGTSNLNVFIDTSRMSGDTVDAFKTWLASNPITVVYEYAEPIETPLVDDVIEELRSLRMYEGSTTIYANSELATLEVEYYKNTENGNAVGEIVRKIEKISEKALTHIETLADKVWSSIGGEGQGNYETVWDYKAKKSGLHIFSGHMRIGVDREEAAISDYTYGAFYLKVGVLKYPEIPIIRASTPLRDYVSFSETDTQILAYEIISLDKAIYLAEGDTVYFEIANVAGTGQTNGDRIETSLVVQY